MEFELKYMVEDVETFQKIWEDEELSKIEEEGSRKEKRLVASYMDTKDGDLRKNGIAMRVRHGEVEGKAVATVKTLIKAEGACHKREEYNVVIDDITKPLSMEIFAHEKVGNTLNKIVDNKEILPIIETDICRKIILLNTEDSLVELALDEGFVKANNKEEHFRELELELVSGPETSLLRLGEKIMGKYNLIPGEISKFARGLRILGN